MSDINTVITCDRACPFLQFDYNVQNKYRHLCLNVCYQKQITYILVVEVLYGLYMNAHSIHLNAFAQRSEIHFTYNYTIGTKLNTFTQFTITSKTITVGTFGYICIHYIQFHTCLHRFWPPFSGSKISPKGLPKSFQKRTQKTQIYVRRW